MVIMGIRMTNKPRNYQKIVYLAKLVILMVVGFKYLLWFAENISVNYRQVIKICQAG
jgi:hypothetical protein